MTNFGNFRPEAKFFAVKCGWETDCFTLRLDWLSPKVESDSPYANNFIGSQERGAARLQSPMSCVLNG